jgi:hypothetical protein
MMGRVLIIVAIAAITLSSTNGKADAGGIAGLVSDASCSAPVPFANVLVVGTRFGAMSGTDGSYSIEGVPSGAYTVRVTTVSHETLEVREIPVTDDRTTHWSFRLRERGSAGYVDDRVGGGAALCSIHDVAMAPVLVPIGYGLNVLRRDWDEIRRARFPNAAPSLDGGCVIGDVTKARVHCCPVCASARNAELSGGKWVDYPPPVSEWRRYQFAGVLEYWAPDNLGSEISRNECLHVQTTQWQGMSIRLATGNAYHIRSEWPSEFDYVVNMIHGEAYPDVGVVTDGNHTELYVRFWVIPKGTDRIVVRLSTDAPAELDVARRVVGSMKFIERPN